VVELAVQTRRREQPVPHERADRRVAIYNKGTLIDAALEEAMDDAEARKASELEIICGRGSGALKKRVLRFLDRKDVRARYLRINKDPGISGHMYVYFRWRRGQ
jgi:dsDNA-specific endonuclease/ATPase MutS2